MHRPLRLFRLLLPLRVFRPLGSSRPLAALFLAVLCLAALPCASAQAADVNPDGSVAPAGGPEAAAKATTPGALETIKKAAAAQGDISPLTVKALQHDPKAMETVGRAPSNPASGGSRGAGSKSSKAMYGDIVIHK